MTDSSRERYSGACVWLTGLSGAGKSVLAKAVQSRLHRLGLVTVCLDGDAVRRRYLSGFTRGDRDRHNRSVATLARSVVDRGHVAVCALISPYRDTRAACRGIVGPNFVEVYVATPLAVCEARDPKGLYARARRGELAAFTGITDPYEPPLQPDLTIVADGHPPDDDAARIVACVLPLSHGATAFDRTA